MMSAAAMMILVAACFAAAVLNLALDSRFRKLVMRIAILFAVAVGTVFYGYGYAWCMGLHVTSLLRALLALCRMFGGVNDLSSIQAAPLLQYPAAVAVFWTGHFLAFYVTASAAIATLGERLLRRIRVTLLRKGPLLLIYGVNAHSVAYGQRMARERGRSVVFVDQDYSPVFESGIKAFGGVLEKGTDALQGTVRFLRQLNMKPGSRKLELAALHTDGRKNLNYARTLLNTMTAMGIHPEQTSLLAAGIGEEVAELQAMGGAGYGSVYAFDDYELTARLIVQKHPPCSLIRFDGKGRAAEDFQAVILGFGRMGRAMLAQLVINGQFCGSRFRADIFDPGAQNGFLHDHPMMRNYDIRFHAASGTSDDFYAFLEENREKVRMIVLCTGRQDKNREIAEDLARWFPWDESMPLIVHATKEDYFWLDENRREMQSVHFLDRDGLDPEQLDDMAMQVHHIYCEAAGSEKTAEEDWRTCRYEDRQNSRACADFYPAVLRAAGKTKEQVLAGDWPPDAETLENLSKTEHLRWCAYQYAAGYASMPEEVWRERAERYRREKEKGFRISRDTRKRLQACLIPWEELDALSQRENEVTGGHVDFKQMDRNNVLMLSRVLKAMRSNDQKKDEGK